MQHVRVADHDVAMQADGLAGIARGVAVEGEGLQTQVAGLAQIQQLGHLVLGQCLGREQVKRLALARQRRGHHRQRVAQRLAGGRGRDHRQVIAVPCMPPRLGLVRIQAFDAAAAQGHGQCGRQIVRQRLVASFPRRKDELPGDAVAVLARQPFGQRASIGMTCGEECGLVGLASDKRGLGGHVGLSWSGVYDAACVSTPETDRRLIACPRLSFVIGT